MQEVQTENLGDGRGASERRVKMYVNRSAERKDMDEIRRRTC